jgi:hypothetical protein
MMIDLFQLIPNSKEENKEMNQEGDNRVMVKDRRKDQQLVGKIFL